MRAQVIPDRKLREAVNDYAEAIIEYRRAIQSMPERVDAHMKLANAYLGDGQSASTSTLEIRHWTFDISFPGGVRPGKCRMMNVQCPSEGLAQQRRWCPSYPPTAGLAGLSRPLPGTRW